MAQKNTPPLQRRNTELAATGATAARDTIRVVPWRYNVFSLGRSSLKFNTWPRICRATVKQQKQTERLMKNEMEIDPILLEEMEWKTFDTLYALDSFGAYWSENERLILKAAEAEEAGVVSKWKPLTRDKLAEFDMELRTARHLHDEIVLPTFRFSCLVMLFTIVERELLRLVRNLDSERKTQSPKFESKRGSLLKPIEVFCKAHFNLRLQDCPEYGALCDLQKVRDCIVHCHGEVSLSRDATYLIGLKGRRPGFDAREVADIEIEPPCIEQFLKEMWRFFIWVFHELKWKVDDSWKGKRWT